ncbi:class II aldolase/adducin family protein [Candidatus Woesearchaeota archaeon]|nr:class II aldolase/adducin family protein [Candidatus Woesearchaeota archaeon]
MKEGTIKFKCDWLKTKPLQMDSIREINEWRKRLYDLGLIGAQHDGIGYGNISIRKNGNQFIITGSGTGKIKELNKEHYTLVTNVDIEKNSLSCRGPITASSESMSHAACYLSDSGINAVIHVHSKTLWEKLVNNAATTDKEAEYGTPEMAHEIIRLIKNNPLGNLIVMGGHEEGIISYGKNLEEAAGVILNYVEGANRPQN